MIRVPLFLMCSFNKETHPKLQSTIGLPRNIDKNYVHKRLWVRIAHLQDINIAKQPQTLRLHRFLKPSFKIAV